MLRKGIEDLVRIAAAGGGFNFEAGALSADELVRVAAAIAGTGAQITIHGTSGRPTQDLVRIAQAGRGGVRFD